MDEVNSSIKARHQTGPRIKADDERLRPQHDHELPEPKKSDEENVMPKSEGFTVA
jgi:hypothetical protein